MSSSAFLGGSRGRAPRTLVMVFATIAFATAHATSPNANSAATALAPETINVAVLPPATPHRVWLVELYSGQLQILDGDTGDLLGSVYSASLSNFASSPRQSKIYVAESVWSRGNRGARQNMITVYDGRTLDLKAEIPLAGRVYMAPLTHNFVLSVDGALGYVYDMQPASSVIVADLKHDRVLSTVDIPGCALAFAWRDRGFSSLCGNGALATVTLGAAGPTITRSAPFFDAENDPVFEESPSDAATGQTCFVSYSGLVYPVHLGKTPHFEQSWSLQKSAGLEAASLKTGSLAWRPGGRLPFALHWASGRLYVLMHAGEPWSQKDDGTELWVVDVATHKMLRRKTLANPVSAIAVSQDRKPLLYLIDSKESLLIWNAETLEPLRKVESVRSAVPYVPGS